MAKVMSNVRRHTPTAYSPNSSVNVHVYPWMLWVGIISSRSSTTGRVDTSNPGARREKVLQVRRGNSDTLADDVSTFSCA